jgi:hypothetical protein
MAKKSDHGSAAIAPEAELACSKPSVPPPPGPTPISDPERLNDLALQIVQGRIALEEVTNLSRQDRDRLAELVAQMITLRSNPAAKRQTRANPYYNPSGSKIIKDGQ